MELKVGMHFRTKDGLTTGKISYIFDETIRYINKQGCSRTVLKENIDIADFNKIRMVRLGDYVNGYRVIDIYYEKLIESKVLLINCNEISNRGLNKITDEDIESIVTKEQFASCEYKLGDSE